MYSWSRYLVALPVTLAASTFICLAGTAQAQEWGPPPAEVADPNGGGGEEAEGGEGSGLPNAYAFAATADGGLSSITQELDNALRDSLAGNRQYSMTDAENLLNGLDFDAAEALQQARELFEGGQTAYENLEMDEAIERFGMALEVYEEQIAHVGDLNNIADCLLHIGAAEVLRGNSRQARDAFQRLLLVDPERRPDPDVFPPPVTEAFDSASSTVQRLRNGRIDITTNPPGGEVFVDGVFQGIAPQELSEFRAGRHYVRVRRQGFIEAGQVIDVSARRPTVVEFTLDPTEDGPVVSELLTQLSREVGEGGNAAAGTVMRLGALLNLEVLVTAIVAPGDNGIMVRVNAWNVMNGRAVASETVGPLESDAMVVANEVPPSAEQVLSEAYRAMHTQQAEQETPIIERPVEPPPPPQPSRPVWQRWWFWTAIGAVVVGAGLGIGLGVSAANEEPGRTNGEVILDL